MEKRQTKVRRRTVSASKRIETSWLGYGVVRRLETKKNLDVIKEHLQTLLDDGSAGNKDDEARSNGLGEKIDLVWFLVDLFSVVAMADKGLINTRGDLSYTLTFAEHFLYDLVLSGDEM